MGLTNAVFGSSEYLFFSRSFINVIEVRINITFEGILINFRGIKSGPAAFLGFLSLKAYLRIETTSQDKKRCVRRLMVNKDAQARKARINDG